ncbi:copper resistance CopC family protein [Actinoplanes sp. CA-054009]
MTRRLLVALLVAGAVLVPGGPAWAHNQLTYAAPAADSRLASAPTSVTLRFVETLKPDFTTIVVSGSDRRRVPSAPPAIQGNTGVLTLTGALANGMYTVAYRTVSVDGHAVQGSYTFVVDDPARPAAAIAVAAPASDDDGGFPVVPVLIAVAAAVAVVAALLLRRRRRPD